jgi:hypothetical protein
MEEMPGQRSRLRGYAAWGAGIASGAAIYFAGSLVLKQLGVPVAIEFDEPQLVRYGRGVEEEVDEALTAPGLCLSILAITIGLGLGACVRCGTLWRAFEPAGRAMWLGWFVGSISGLGTTTLLWMLFPQGGGTLELVRNLLEIGLVALSALLGVRLARRNSSGDHRYHAG